MCLIAQQRCVYCATWIRAHGFLVNLGRFQQTIGASKIYSFWLLTTKNYIFSVVLRPVWQRGTLVGIYGYVSGLCPNYGYPPQGFAQSRFWETGFFSRTSITVPSCTCLFFDQTESMGVFRNDACIILQATP